MLGLGLGGCGLVNIADGFIVHFYHYLHKFHVKHYTHFDQKCIRQARLEMRETAQQNVDDDYCACRLKAVGGTGTLQSRRHQVNTRPLPRRPQQNGKE